MNEVNADRHQHVMRILAEILESDIAQRRNLLAVCCADDEALRDEIDRLLKHEKPAVNFMEGSLFGADDEQAESLIGAQIGSYRIVEQIGSGGMGTVYRAVRSDEEYQKQVAIKLIKHGLGIDVLKQRFRTERQILANLDHQYIARLFDGGTSERGPYLVMEYVEGQPINGFADDQRLSTVKRLKLFLKICEAVEYAHCNEVIHRDIKPGNILVNKDGVPKLLDFGIAKLTHSGSPLSSEATASWRVMTPEYASPEQVRGEPITTASDVYSLGAVLYELLTGHRPHRIRGRSLDEMKQVICTEVPEKPSTIISRTEKRSANNGATPSAITPESVSQTRDGAPERLRRSLRGDLDNIVLMALRKEPERRYDSVAQFAQDIRRHLDSLPIRARKDALTYRAAKFLTRHRAYALTTAVVALLCLLIGISVTLFTTGARGTRSIAVIPFVNVSEDTSTEYLSDGLTDSLINRLSRFPNLTVPARASVFRYKGKATNAQTIGRDLGVETLLTGRVVTNADQLLVEVSLIDAKSNDVIWSQPYQGDSSHLLLLQQKVARSVLSKLRLPPATDEDLPKLYTKDDEAYRLYLRGNYFWNKRTYDGFTRAIRYYQQAIDKDPGYALAYDGLAKSYGLLGAYMYDSSDNAFVPAKLAALKALKLDPDLAEAHTTLALVSWLYDWDWARADREFRQAIDLNSQYVTAHHWYGLYLGEMGRVGESISEEKRALELDPVSIPIHADLGRVYFWARRYDEALKQYQKAMEMDPTFSTFYVELRYVYEQKQMYAEWFGTIDKLYDVNENSRPAFITEDWKEFARLSATSGLPHDRAENYARVGDKQNAFEQLDLAYRAHDHRVSQLKVNPVWDSLRSDQRFAELLRRMNLAS